MADTHRTGTAETEAPAWATEYERRVASDLSSDEARAWFWVLMERTGKAMEDTDDTRDA